MAEITIQFRGLCTHLVNGTRHPNAPPNLDLHPIVGRQPQYRVYVPFWDAFPDRVKQEVPQHFPRLRYLDGDLEPSKLWQIERNGHYQEVALTGVAIWFSGVQEGPTTPPAQALHGIPSIWTNAGKDKPELDPHVANDLDNKKVAAYVDFFGGQSLVIDDGNKKFPNRVKATFQVPNGQVPLLMWKGRDDVQTWAAIRLGATIQISNSARPPEPCCRRDYLLHYGVTQLNLDDKNAWPKWPDNPDRGSPDTAYCSSGTYP